MVIAPARTCQGVGIFTVMWANGYSLATRSKHRRVPVSREMLSNTEALCVWALGAPYRKVRRVIWTRGGSRSFVQPPSMKSKQVNAERALPVRRLSATIVMQQCLCSTHQFWEGAAVRGALSPKGTVREDEERGEEA